MTVQELFDKHANDIYHINKELKNYVELSGFYEYLKYFDNRNCLNKTEGYSVKGRPINSVTFGNGNKRILMWAQMHGNEEVSRMGLMLATEILFRINNSVSKTILENTRITVVFMLNPDGAELNTRRNALGIDLNRDARALSAPESRILEDLRKSVKPHFAFNLHDQDIYYGVEGKNTELAFLVPAADTGKSLTPARKNAMAIVSDIIKSLKTSANIAKYNDSFMPTAFGDHFSANGISTILIEAGHNYEKGGRQGIGILFAKAILQALHVIATGNYDTGDIREYDQLPFNQKDYFLDAIIRYAKIDLNDKCFVADIGLRRYNCDTEAFGDDTEKYVIWEIGDLSSKKAFTELDGSSGLLGSFAWHEQELVRLADATMLHNFIKTLA